MLKISIISDSDQAIQFQLEGKLVGPWVEELQRLSDEALSHQKAVSLDLERVWFVDSARSQRCCAISLGDKCLKSIALNS